MDEVCEGAAWAARGGGHSGSAGGTWGIQSLTDRVSSQANWSRRAQSQMPSKRLSPLTAALTLLWTGRWTGAMWESGAVSTTHPTLNRALLLCHLTNTA